MRDFTIRSLLSITSVLNAVAVFFLVGVLLIQNILEDFIEFLENERESRKPKTNTLKCGGVCFLVLLTFFTGCNRYTVSVKTNPAYGIIYVNGERVGVSSVRLKYKIPEDAIFHDSICFPKIHAIWYSYATAESTITIPKCQRKIDVVFRSDSMHKDVMNERSIRSGVLKHTVARRR